MNPGTATQLSWLWSLPFVGILLTIALAPITIANLWHKYYGRIAFFWAGILGLALIISQGFGAFMHTLVETMGHHFVPFIIFLTALYITTSGVHIKIKADASPLLNTCFLCITGLMASVIGTTGAAMLFIAPFIHLNKERTHKIHLMIFYIFIVCNVGGGLTPIGDPPLFLGYLEGIDFFWPLIHMARPVLGILFSLLIIFYAIDFYYFKKEGLTHTTPLSKVRVRIQQKKQFIVLSAIITLIATNKWWDFGQNIHILGIPFQISAISRDLLLIVCAGISLLWRPIPIEKEPLLNWAPLKEVAKLFAVIFFTAAPVLAILKAGPAGAFAPLHEFLHHTNGMPKNDVYFWISGFLSSILDNAPTYLIFFHMAGGDPTTLMGPMATTLLAFSMGSVFMGAMTYIGNAPNFMVKSIAEMHEIQMPTFLGFMAWSVGILLPILALMGIVCVSCGI